MTTQQNILNFRTARRLVGQRLFGPDFDGSVSAYSALSAGDQIRLNDEVAAYIVYDGNPASFSPEQIEQAQRIVSRPHFRTPLADPSFSFTEFGEGLAENVAPALERVWGIIAIGAVVYFAVLAYKTHPSRQ